MVAQANQPTVYLSIARIYLREVHDLLAVNMVFVSSRFDVRQIRLSQIASPRFASCFLYLFYPSDSDDRVKG
ncbi:hypothetical protein V6N13_047107 [Hibiscus sabdariffa]|uniref:Uncharacterized protein n=1 Tax=Hibiscus sabdariffa TaxID=183260 RepID=A0ABR1ZYC6_9ROSI